MKYREILIELREKGVNADTIKEIERWWAKIKRRRSKYGTKVKHPHEYAAWFHIRDRETICSRWRNSFRNFLADMGPRPPGHRFCILDRYDPITVENCRWVKSPTYLDKSRHPKEPVKETRHDRRRMAAGLQP